MTGLRTPVLLALVGGGLVVLLSGATAVAEVGGVDPTGADGLLPTAQAASATLGQAAPVARALGLVGLAGAVGLLAARGRARPVVAVVLVLCGAGLLVACATLVADPAGALEAAGGAGGAATWRPPVLLVALGGVLLLGAGGLAVAPGARAGPGLPARFEQPAARTGAGGPGQALDGAGGAAAPAAPRGRDDAAASVRPARDEAADAWRALDRGEDPTT